MFKSWSGLKINLSKTYLTVFGKLADRPGFIEELKIRWCTEFKLLGIYFDSTLSKMHVNYEKAIESVRQEINSWNYRFLTIFGKVTVIKTMCIPKLNHIAVVVPNPSCAHLRSLESEIKQLNLKCLHQLHECKDDLGSSTTFPIVSLDINGHTFN